MNGGVYMSLVYVKNKNNGVTYVYESSGYWDKNKQQARNKRNCIGKLDPVTGEFVPSKRLDPQQAAVRDPAVTASAQVVGPAVVLDEFSKRTGLEKLLKSCFPDTHRQILAMADYLAIEGGALSYCESWAKSHKPALYGVPGKPAHKRDTLLHRDRRQADLPREVDRQGPGERLHLL